MPKQTFYNLSDEKRQRLTDAIRDEFSRVAYDEVSINQIIRSAGIPRGSFYQYFEDKKDALEYLLVEFRHQAVSHVQNSITQSGGDLFQLFLDLLDFTNEFLSSESNNAFCRNIFADARHNLEFVIPTMHQHSHSEMVIGVFEGVDQNNLDIRSPSDYENMLGILLPLAGFTFAQAFYKSSEFGEVREQFAAKLELLKRGFVKKESLSESVMQ